MPLTATQRELFRKALLTALEESKPYCPTVPILQISLRSAGFPRLEPDEIRAELEYLAEKGLCAREEKRLVSPENSGWRITASGRDYLAAEGLA